MAKHAFLLLSDPENPGKFANPLTYAAQLDAAGHDVVAYFDGAATNWFEDIESHAPPAVEAYRAASDRGLIRQHRCGGFQARRGCACRHN